MYVQLYDNSIGTFGPTNPDSSDFVTLRKKITIGSIRFILFYIYLYLSTYVRISSILRLEMYKHVQNIIQKKKTIQILDPFHKIE